MSLQEVFEDMTVANGRPLPFKGRGKFQLKVDELEVVHEVFVAETDIDAILGYDFLSKYNCTVDAGRGAVTVGSTQQATVNDETDSRKVVARTVVVPHGSEQMVAGRIRDGPLSSDLVVV